MSLALKGLQDIKWKVVDLPDIVFFQEGPGVRKTQYTQDGVKLLNVANLQKGKIDLTTSERYISKEEAYGRYEHFLVDEGDLIIASSGIQISYFEEKMGFITEEHLPLCMNTSTIRFKSLDEEVLNIRYFMYFLKTNFFKKQIQRLITGSAQLNFGPSHLKQIKVILPEIAIQDQIVELLDTTQNMIDKRQQQIEALSALKQSIFLDMFGDPFLNPYDWKATTLKELADIIMGQSPPGTSYNNEQKGTPLLNGPTEFSDIYPKEVQWTTEPKRFSEEGDILFCVRGATAGRLNISDKKYAIGRGLASIRPSKKEDENFIFLVLDYMYNYFQQTSDGSTFININKTTLEDIPIFILPKKIKSKYNDIYNQIELELKTMKSSLNKLEEMYESLINKAFNGELFKEDIKV